MPFSLLAKTLDTNIAKVDRVQLGHILGSFLLGDERDKCVVDLFE